MMYILRDKRGINHEILYIEPDTLTKFDVEDLLAEYMRTRIITDIIDFNIIGFQRFLYRETGVRSAAMKPIPLNLKV